MSAPRDKLGDEETSEHRCWWGLVHEVVGDLEGETWGCVVGPQQRLLKQQTPPWTKGDFLPAPDNCLHPIAACTP